MAKKWLSYWKTHHWGIVQGVSGVYCAAFSTWEHFHAQTAKVIETASSPTQSGGGMMHPAYAMPFWLWVGISVLGLSVAIPAIMRLLQARSAASVGLQKAQQSALAGIPTLSAINGIEPEITFDPKVFFANAYYSPLTAEIEHNIKVVANSYSPSDLEGFYTRFIGIGWISTQHEQTWLIIFGSQLRALAVLNKQGFVSMDELKSHYDEAADVNPGTYKSFPFSDWKDYMRARMLIKIHPSLMVEITHNGRDFLKYLAHTGKDTSKQPN